jgi:hypothetical protein
MLSSEQKHLAKREEDFDDDQDDHVPFDAEGAAGLDEAEGCFDGARDEF